MKLISSLVILFCLLGNEVYAEQFYMVINGRSFHQENRNYNETNTGLGFELDFKERENYIPFIAASFFEDSVNNTSKYIGGGIKRRYRLDNDTDGWFADLGLIGFAMTRKDYKDNQPFIAALPFATIGKGPVSINMTYIPTLSPKAKALTYFQLKLRVKEW